MKIAYLAAAALVLPAAPAVAQDMDLDTELPTAGANTEIEYDGTELVDSTARFRTADGIDEEIEFDNDGIARIRTTDGVVRNARYSVANDQLCIDEDDDSYDRCYSYATQYQPGSTYRVTDTRGVTSDVTFDMDDDDDNDRRYLTATYGERG